MHDDIPKITLKAARVNACLDQKTAAEKLDISESTLRSYENGTTFPDIITVRKMEDVYQYPSSHIIFGNNHG